ncbi:MAG: molybdate ABC transporter permease subunit [Maioricimonas sp. JB049]
MMLTPQELDAIRLSVIVGGAAVAGSLPFGIVLGWLLARCSFPGKAVVETLLNLPLVLPPVVTGYVLLVTFGRLGWLVNLLDRTLGIRFVFDWKGAAVAAAVVSFPLMVRAHRLAFAALDPQHEQAARTLGASRTDAFLTVSLPLARPGIIAGCVLAFARSIGEFGATIMIAGNIAGVTQTIPLYIYEQLSVPGGLEASRRIVIVSVIIAAAALLLGEYLDRRGRSRLRAD